MLKTICYISDSKINDTSQAFENLIASASTNNINNKITGILVYQDRNFLQVLEGEPQEVDATFKRINSDTRHGNLFIIINTKAEQRFFEDYNYGFTIIKDKHAVEGLKNYLEWLKNGDNIIAQEIITMVENFISYSS